MEPVVDMSSSRQKKQVYMRNVIFIAIWLCLASIKVGAAEPEKPLSGFQFYTEEYPPYNYSVERQITGIAVDLIIESAKLLNVKLPNYAFKEQPWARSYRTVLTREKTALVTAARTKHREELFQWVGPIATTSIVLIGKKSSNVTIKNNEQIKNYSIGVIIDDVGEQLMEKENISPMNLENAYTAEALVHMLEYGRIDLISYEEKVALWSIHQAGYDPNDYEVVYVLEDLNLYYALNKATPPEHTKALQWALDKLKQKDEYESISKYDAIVKKYQKWDDDLR